MAVLVGSRVFRDVSVFGGMLGWDLGFRPLSSGEAKIQASAVVGEHVVVTRLRLQLRYHQLGTPPPGTLTFGVPISPMRDWFGRPYRSGSILPFNQAGGIDGVSEDGFHAMTVSVFRDFLVDVASACQLDAPASLFDPSADTILEDSPATRRLRARLTRLMSDGPDGPGWTSDVAIDLLSAGTARAPRFGTRRAPRRSRALRQALDFVRDNDRSPIEVKDLCEELGVPVRTMNRAFNERFGIGPKAYLKGRRLVGARQALLDSPTTAVIADVANEWGFWHLGQFARDYRTLFGELPSDTRRQRTVSLGS